MVERFGFADALGPEKVIEITDQNSGLRALLVVDNTAAGPSIGGCRMAPDVTAEECSRLARAMTFKNAAAGLPHGGGKSVIVGDPGMPTADKERLIRALARAIGEIDSYIPGPDMGTDEAAMAWMRDEIGRAVGLPRELGGIPLDEIGATGFGLAAAARAAEEVLGLPLSGARIAVQGYGAVGRWAARNLVPLGARLVAVSDSRGGAIDPAGLDLARLVFIQRQPRRQTMFVDRPGQAVGHGRGARGTLAFLLPYVPMLVQPPSPLRPPCLAGIGVGDNIRGVVGKAAASLIRFSAREATVLSATAEICGAASRPEPRRRAQEVAPVHLSAEQPLHDRRVRGVGQDLLLVLPVQLVGLPARALMVAQRLAPRPLAGRVHLVFIFL